ncbi:MAG: hypothetical protein EA423_10480 [Phycisphaerales bacterium]|nr:MAG: hypothetical protein EA423_10480 [Phycisphaerales bacterium]
MAGPLSGQIIINEQNLTPPGMWGGVVNLPSTLPGGPITIGPNEPSPFDSPLYGVPSATVGGGSIGLAPFGINIADTDGANSCLDPESVVIHHYGPVYAVGSNPPVKVFALDGTVEVEVTSDFTISVDDDPFTLDRTVTVTLPPNTTFQDDYPGLCIVPVRAPETGYSVLRCALVQGGPPVADWSFSQMHDCDCPADLNGDGVVDADDFFLYLSLFADGDPLADINGDGVIDADDFFAYLTLFAAGC